MKTLHTRACLHGTGSAWPAYWNLIGFYILWCNSTCRVFFFQSFQPPVSRGEKNYVLKLNRLVLLTKRTKRKEIHQQMPSSSKTPQLHLQYSSRKNKTALNVKPGSGQRERESECVWVCVSALEGICVNQDTECVRQWVCVLWHHS